MALAVMNRVSAGLDWVGSLHLSNTALGVGFASIVAQKMLLSYPSKNYIDLRCASYWVSISISTFLSMSGSIPPSKSTYAASASYSIALNMLHFRGKGLPSEAIWEPFVISVISGHRIDRLVHLTPKTGPVMLITVVALNILIFWNIEVQDNNFKDMQDKFLDEGYGGKIVRQIVTNYGKTISYIFVAMFIGFLTQHLKLSTINK